MFIRILIWWFRHDMGLALRGRRRIPKLGPRAVTDPSERVRLQAQADARQDTARAKMKRWGLIR